MRDHSSSSDPPVSVHPRTQDGYTEALKRFYEFEAVAYPSFFRRTGLGWVLLNILISLFLSAMLLFIEFLGAMAVEGDLLDGSREPSDGAYAGSFFISLLAGILGWLLFCYLRSRRARWLWLAIPYVGGVVAGVVILASSSFPTD